jgi:hypothetical protein
MVVPDPDAAGRPELLRRAMAGWSGAIGPPVPLPDAAKSLRWAEAAVRLVERGLLPAGEVLHCTEHTQALVLLQPEELIDDLSRRALAPLAHCGPTHARRMADTLLAWLETRGGAPEVAARLGVHPQTVRYRLRQIRELWGDEIDDPDRRFELELVLRARRLRDLPGGPAAPPLQPVGESPHPVRHAPLRRSGPLGCDTRTGHVSAVTRPRTGARRHPRAHCPLNAAVSSLRS